MRNVMFMLAAMCVAALIVGCQTTPKSEEGKENLQEGADRADLLALGCHGASD